jgi:hypothetical protein
MVSHLIGSCNFAKVGDIELLFFPKDNNAFHRDAAKLVCSWLNASDLARMRRVNRSWNCLILDCSKFKNTLMVSSLLFSARKTAQMIKSPWTKNCQLLEILEVEIQHEFSTAQERAETFKEQNWKALALLEVAKVDPKHDLTAAKVAAESIETEGIGAPRKDSVLAKIVEEEAKHNLADAIKTAETIEEGEKKKEALLAIIKIVVQERNFDKAKELAHTLRIHFCNYYYQAIAEIVKTEAQFSMKTAQAYAQTLNPPTVRACAIAKIVEIQAQSNIEEAEVTALTIPSQFRLEANKVIVRALAKTDFEKAKKMVMKFPAYGCVEVVKVIAQTNLEDAKNYAFTFNSPQDLDRALLEIVKIEAENNLPAAEVTALLIEDPELRDQGLFEILKKSTNLTHAENIANEIDSLAWRVRADLVIIKIRAKENLADANAAVLQIADPTQRVRAILEIVKIILGNVC